MRTSAPLRQGCEVNYDASDLAGLETGGPIEVVSMPKGVNGHRVTSHYKLDMKTMEGKSALGLQLLGSPPPHSPLESPPLCARAPGFGHLEIMPGGLA